MSELRTLFGPEDIRPFYPEIVPMYQKAFAGEPWYEVSKCVADESAVRKCIGGFSALTVGTMCDLCGSCPARSAYEYGELVSRFEIIGASRPTVWYTERNEQGLTLAAVAWKANAERIATEKYSDKPMMNAWLNKLLPKDVSQPDRRWSKDFFDDRHDVPNLENVAWLDEVFADNSIKPSGNLNKFGSMCMGMAEVLNVEFVAFRTINPKMIRASIKTFGDKAQILLAGKETPDRRDFVLIDTMFEDTRTIGWYGNDKSFAERKLSSEVSVSGICRSSAKDFTKAVAKEARDYVMERSEPRQSTRGTTRSIGEGSPFS